MYGTAHVADCRQNVSDSKTVRRSEASGRKFGTPHVVLGFEGEVKRSEGAGSGVQRRQQPAAGTHRSVQRDVLDDHRCL